MVYGITSITTKKTRQFKTSIGNFLYRNIKPDLYRNFIEKDFDNKKYYLATPAKAIFDLIYFATFDNVTVMKDYLLSSSRINWEALSNNDKQELKLLLSDAKSTKLKSILKILIKANIL